MISSFINASSSISSVEVKNTLLLIYIYLFRGIPRRGLLLLTKYLEYHNKYKKRERREFALIEVAFEVMQWHVENIN